MEGIINIAGVMPRIGTTTFALQLIGFLKANNYNAAYVERNPNRYIENAIGMYASGEEDNSVGKYSCEGIDLFPETGMEYLTAGGSPYDYIICDFGNVQQPDFSRSSNIFKEKGVPIIVAGLKANELPYTEQILQDKGYRKAAYVFNFTRKEDEAEVLELMKELSPVTAFLPYTPDPFIYAGNAEQAFYTVMNHVLKRLQEGNVNGKV